MKKKLLVGIIMLCSIIFTGCVDADVTVDLDNGGTGRAIVQVVGPGAIFDNISEDTVNDWAKSYEKVEKISESDKVGYRFTTRKGAIDEVLKEVTNLNDTIDVNGDTDSAQNDGSVNCFADELYQKYVDIEEDQRLFSSTYNISLKLKDAIDNEMSSGQQAVVSFLGHSSTIGLHIKSPIKAEGSNATSESKEDGKYVYNWDYTISDVKNINYSTKVPNIKNIIIAGVCALFILAILIAVLLRKRK